MKSNRLKNALPIVAAAYGEKFGIKVSISGGDAYTDGKHIVIPNTFYDDPHYQNIAWGYLSHEAAHIRYTNFEVVASTKKSQPLRFALLNIVEDVRVESLLGQAYPGTRNTISNTLEYMIKHNQFSLSPNASPVMQFQQWLLLKLRTEYLQQTVLNALYHESSQRISAVFTFELVQKMELILANVAQLTSTQDALDLVDRLLMTIKTQAQKIPAKNQTSPQVDRVQASNQDSGIEQPLSSASSGTNKPIETVLNNKEQSGEAVNTLNQLLSAGKGDLLGDLFEHASAILKSHPQSYTPPLSINHTVVAKKGEGGLLTTAIKESAKLRARLRGLIQSSQDLREMPKAYGRRIASKRLASSQLGQNRFFIKRIHKSAPNAAVHLLIDASSSMANIAPHADNKQTLATIANETALSLALALEGIKGVSLEVSYFPSQQSRVDVCTVLRNKQNVRKHAAYFDQTPRGQTPMSNAIWYAAHELLKKKEMRKVLIVITDGSPDNTRATQDVIQRCKEGGFEMLGIGIMTDSVKHLFTNHLIIKNATELKEKLFVVTENLLIAR